ncbi:protein hothead, partial [Phtheirospermum japonicum]
YDYIIIGGGTAGCPLAATLSQNATVLLLEPRRLPLRQPQHHRPLRLRKSPLRPLPRLPFPALHIGGRRHQLAGPGPRRRQLSQRRLLHTRRRGVRARRRMGRRAKKC